MKKGAIIFVLDSSYLIALKTFLYSVRNALKHKKEDIVILTNDPKVKNDIFVQNIADRVILFTDEQLEPFAFIKNDKVLERLKIEKIGKYTFLKFFAFSDLGYDYHLFFDVDMICLKPDFRFSELIMDCDFAAVQTMGFKYLNIKHGEKKTKEKQKEIYEKIINQEYTSLPNINSGLMYIGNKLLGQKSVNTLVEYASSKSYALEQLVTFKFVKESEINKKPFPLFYNFTHIPSVKLGKKYFKKIRPKIVFLHFNQEKPWNKKRNWFYNIWHKTHSKSLDWVFRIEKGKSDEN